MMLEAGVPVVYGYIADAHDDHVNGVAFGPGEAGYVAQLASYNEAFGKFFERLEHDDITPENTLFIITADENDHFAGGLPSPKNCDGVKTPCTYAVLGEVDADLSRLLATETGDTTKFAVHSDSAPTFYVNGRPGQMDAVTRKLEHDVAVLTAFNPITGVDNRVTAAIADQQEQSFLHMVTADPNRTPTFILFGDPDFFLFSSGSTKTCSPLSACSQETNGFAWNHGDFQPEITNTWLGLVGPGIDRKGATGEIFSDHTDIRPTMISLAGLVDDYSHDGRVLFEVLQDHAIPKALRQHRDTLSDLAAAYKAINAPLGKLTLQHATAAVEGSDSAYSAFTPELAEFMQQRNALAGKIIKMLEGAEFADDKIDENAAKQAIEATQDLVASIP
jgi:arylsulfatase A-like enzyme